MYLNCRVQCQGPLSFAGFLLLLFLLSSLFLLFPFALISVPAGVTLNLLSQFQWFSLACKNATSWKTLVEALPWLTTAPNAAAAPWLSGR